MHDQLLESAKKAADKLFSDTTVALSETKAFLCDLEEHIGSLIDAIKYSIREEQKREFET
jgi:hypothetical protein